MMFLMFLSKSPSVPGIPTMSSHCCPCWPALTGFPLSCNLEWCVGSSLETVRKLATPQAEMRCLVSLVMGLFRWTVPITVSSEDHTSWVLWTWTHNTWWLNHVFVFSLRDWGAGRACSLSQSVRLCCLLSNNTTRLADWFSKSWNLAPPTYWLMEWASIFCTFASEAKTSFSAKGCHVSSYSHSWVELLCNVVVPSI